MDVAQERNQPPPGAEHRRVYTAKEKADLLEQFLLARAAKEGNDLEICERLGVSRTAIYSWKATLEKGGDLEDTTYERKTQPMAAKKKANKGNRLPRGGTPIATRIQAVQEYQAQGFGSLGKIAAKYNVSTSSINNWNNEYKQGKYNAPGRPVNGHGQPAQVVMFDEQTPKTAIQRAPALMRPEDTDLKMQLALAHAEIARLKQRNKKLAQLVGDDE